MALLANQKVLTLDYWKPASKLEVGDYVFDRNGKPVRITLVQQYRSEQCYEVTFGDHMAVGGDAHLGFPIETEKYRRQVRAYKAKKKFKRPLKPMTVEYLLTQPLRQRRDNRSSFSIQTTKPLEFPNQDLPVPPFIFGFWFVNHKPKGHMMFTKGREKFITDKFREYGYKVIPGMRHPNGERQFTTYPTIPSQLFPPNPIKIPNNYLLASAEQRLELLQGLIAGKSRQYAPSKDTFRLTHNHYPTVLGIIGLIESLGNQSKVEYYSDKNSYTIYFKTRLRLIEGQVSPPVKVLLGRRFIKRIEPVAPQLCVHIETDGEDNSFLVGEGFITCL